jgi:AraC-like DNA-binding protein
MTRASNDIILRHGFTMTFTTMPSHSLLSADDQTIALFPSLSELTIAQTANFLHMSERHVNDLLDMGEFAFREENGERLVQRDSLLDFEQERERVGRVLDEMVRWNQEMGFYD